MFWCFKVDVNTEFQNFPSVHDVDFSSVRFARGIHFRHIFVQLLLKTKIFRSQNLRTSTANYPTRNTPTYDISTHITSPDKSVRHNYQQIYTLAHHQTITTQLSTATHIEYIKPSAIQDITFRWTSKEDFRGVY
jgi:hypothetical protein